MQPDANEPARVVGPTRDRIIDAALDRFGARGVDAVSLDEIAAAVGVRKQTVLYWFVSKDDLVLAVAVRTADQLVVAIEAATRRAGDGFSPIEALVRVAFRAAVRRPALLGLVGELHRLPSPVSDALIERLAPATGRARTWLLGRMDAGQIRRCDPSIAMALVFSAVVGVATQPVVLRASGWAATPAGLRRLRRDLLAFLHAALAPR